MSKARGLILSALIICQGFFLSGCDSTLWNRAPPPSPPTVGVITGAATGAVIGSAAGATAMGAAIGGIWGGILGHALMAHYSLVEFLMYNGVQVIRVGDDVELILPSDKFFYRDSANLNPNYYPILNNIITLLRSFDKISIRIAAYTDNCGEWQRNLALSKLQAETMMNYLWNAGVDSRLLYAMGCGEANPIADNSTPVGQYANRRIEITLRKLQYEPLV